MHDSESFFVVGIGASAGGLDALTRFFKQLPPVSNAAFVVVQHLLPQHPSLLSKILSDKTQMEVIPIRGPLKIERNKVYVLTEGLMLTVENGVLQVRRRTNSEIINRAVDIFFHSLAADVKEKAIGIILSGMGSDGLQGSKAIEEAGGKIMVQDPDSTKFKSMPSEVIKRDSPNLVLPPEELAHSILWFIEQQFVTKT
ncbi:chemotaxis protein CheB [Pedobacter sp. SYSU D00535]|uniref:chemotaxis protein CheB n=1 Tax=Pedobacter sp. SYSU D00535 TaxID=2810308 RepID=UPI001A97C8E7|nr:chemotaxis protein CheB [Pedobacter sp. SYSU D00535]